MKTICHLTSVHDCFDGRIYHRAAKCARDAGYRVVIIASASQDQINKAKYDNIKIISIADKKTRLGRFFLKTMHCFQQAKKVNADIYQFHDPELIPIGILLKLLKKTVVYDVHEDLGKDILDKTWIPKIWKKPLSFFLDKFELLSSILFFNVISATPTIAQKFSKIRRKTTIVRNFSHLSGPLTNLHSQKFKKWKICYIGTLGLNRGSSDIIAALNFLKVDVELVIAGTFGNTPDENYIKALPEWKYVNYLGHINNEQILDVLKESHIGLIPLRKTDAYDMSLPTKLFDYMSSGLPVIATNLKETSIIIKESKCGILVSPSCPKEIADGIEQLIKNGEQTRQMGLSGKKYFENKYSWKNEQQYLLDFYKQLIK